MRTDATVIIKCATCPETLNLYYSHESIGSKTLPDDIKHDATISSDWYCIEGLFYCDNCAEGLEDTREEQARFAQAENDLIFNNYSPGPPYADAIREKLNNGEG